jgi:hypothetical protein
MKELVQELNDLNIVQTSCDWEENIPDNIYNKYFKETSEEVDSALDMDKHRWYETSTTVVEINGEFMGINLVTDIFSENMEVSDCGEGISFFEMEAFATISYRTKSE